MIITYFIFIGFCLIYSSTLARADQGYFVKFLEPQEFLPLIVGGNGKFLIGEAEGCRNLVSWTETKGIEILNVAPLGYDLVPKAVSVDGKFVTGVIQKCPTSPITDTGVMFWWSATDGLKLLTPLDDQRNAVWQMGISSDGKTVEFFCPETSSIPTCPGSTSDVAGWKPMARIWTAQGGFQILGKNLKQPFDYITTAGDFRSFVYGHMLLLPKNGLDKLSQVPVLTLQRSDGKSIALPDIPSFSDIIANGIPLDFLVKMRTFVMNKNVSLVALPVIWPKNSALKSASLIWDSNGREVAIKNLPAGCNEFEPQFISNADEIIGIASCYGGGQGIEMNVSKNRAQTISTWLTDHGVGNDIGDYAGILSASDDGKTILGFGNMCQSVGVESATSNHINVSPMPRHEFSTVCNGQAFLFVAHIPQK